MDYIIGIIIYAFVGTIIGTLTSRIFEHQDWLMDDDATLFGVFCGIFWLLSPLFYFMFATYRLTSKVIDRCFAK